MLQSRNVLLIACAVLMVTAVLANAAVKYINLQVLIEMTGAWLTPVR